MTEQELRAAIGLDSTDFMRSVEQKGIKLAHYTSSQSFCKMLSSQSILLRNARIMNDFAELNFGYDCLVDAFNSKEGEDLKNIFGSINSEKLKDILSSIDSRSFEIANSTYMFCMSLHEPEENTLGRLSMWRAYGGRYPVCILVNPDFLKGDTVDLGIFSFVVQYHSRHTFVEQFKSAQASFLEAHESKIPEDILFKALYTYIVNAFIATKHVAF